MILKFFITRYNFFDLLEEQVGHVVEAACFFTEVTAQDPILVIQWKDIYQDAETVLDVCEHVVHVVDSIMVKQA